MKTSSPTHSEQPQKLFNRNFVLLWQGQLVSQLGHQGFLLGMMFWTMEATGSASLMGLLMMLSSLPGLFLGPVGGSFADRHSRRTIIVISDLSRGLSVLTLAALMLWLPESRQLLITALLSVATLNGVSNAFFNPAIFAAIPDLVPQEKVAAANSLNQISIQGSTALGQTIGGVLYRSLGAPVLFFIDGMSYLFSALSELFIEIPQKVVRKAGEDRSIFRVYAADTMVGLRYVWERPGIRSLLFIFAALNFFMMPMFVLLPFYVEETLHAKADTYGLIMGLFGGGNLVGYGLAAALRVSGRSRRRWVLGALPVIGALLALSGIAPSFGTAVFCFFGIGLLTALVDILLVTLLQTTTPGEIRGRVMGLILALSRAVSPIGMGLGGVLGDLTDKNVPAIYLGCGSACWLIAGLAANRRHFRDFLAWEKGQPVTVHGSSDVTSPEEA